MISRPSRYVDPSVDPPGRVPAWAHGRPRPRRLRSTIPDGRLPFGGAPSRSRVARLRLGYGTCVAGFAAVGLAGGAGRRMGGADKPLRPVAGQSMLSRVLAAVGDAEPRVIVGPVPPDLPVP